MRMIMVPRLAMRERSECDHEEEGTICEQVIYF